MAEEKGPLGILPVGPIRKTLREKRNSGTFKDRRFLGIMASDSEEIRGFRRNIVSSSIASVLLAAYLGTALERLPKALV